MKRFRKSFRKSFRKRFKKKQRKTRKMRKGGGNVLCPNCGNRMHADCAEYVWRCGKCEADQDMTPEEHSDLCE